MNSSLPFDILPIDASLIDTVAPSAPPSFELAEPDAYAVPASNPIRLLIVDDHQLVRDGLRLLLSTFDAVEVVAVAADGEQAIRYCDRFHPDVILMDMVMPHMDGPTATARICALFPHVQVIALTSFLEEELIQQAIQAGAISFLLKTVSANTLVAAIRAAYQKRSIIDSEAAQMLVRALNRPPSLGHDLTNREHDVLNLLSQGLSNKAIANELVLSCGTVRVYVSNILSKLGAHNRTEAARLAIEHKLVMHDN